MADEQCYGRLAFRRIFRWLRAGGSVPHRDDRPGRRPFCLHLGRCTVCCGPGRAGVHGYGFLVRPAVASDRRHRYGRMLHARAQGAHRPSDEQGAARPRRRFLHGVLQRRDSGLLCASRLRPGVVRLAGRLPVHGGRPGPGRHRACDAGRAWGTGGGQGGPQSCAGLPPCLALAEDHELYRRLYGPRGRAVRHALLGRAVPCVLPRKQRRIHAERHAASRPHLARRGGFEHRRRGAGPAGRARAPDFVRDAGDIRAQRRRRLFLATALRRRGAPLPGLFRRDPGRLSRAYCGSHQHLSGGPSGRNTRGAFDTGVQRLAVRAAPRGARCSILPHRLGERPLGGSLS